MKVVSMVALLMALSAMAATEISPSTPSVVLECGDLRAEIVPAWAGRLMFFGRKGGRNVLWTNPDASDAVFDQNGNPRWPNFGGEKTWVGSQEECWLAFAGKDKGTVWPPPAWFDSMPLRVVHSDPTNLVLRSDAHAGGDWVVAMERSFSLGPDRLVMRQRLLPEAIGSAGAEPLPDDIRRLWSITQVPRPDFVLLHPWGEARHVEHDHIPAPVPSEVAGWMRIDLAQMSGSGKMEADGDALAMPLADGTGWFLLEQAAPKRFLDAFASPGRAMVYGSEPDFKPSPYAELEFAAYGPDAEQTIVFSFPDTLP